MTDRKQNLLALSFEELEAWIVDLGWKKYRAKQILSWLYRRRAADFEEMTDLSKADRTLLAEKASLHHLEIVTHQRSVDGTQKFLLELEDGNRIESVLIPGDDRLTLCISSQAGCTLDCGFCLTAQEKLKRNLKAHEIVDQILTVQRTLPEETRITNVVMMGMGEPLANFNHVVEALKRMISPIGLGFSPRRVTVSTAGMVPQILKLWEAVPVNLSISLNATTNAVRDQIMPKVNRLYPIEELLKVCKAFPLPSRRRITFEYVLLAGVNDTPEDAARLVRLSRGIRCKVNLIPFNEFPGSPYRRPTDEQVLRFQKTLLDADLTATIRKSKGRDILAACGQLNSEFAARPLSQKQLEPIGLLPS
ncbi:MAG: 23S rRNA (adenine(2503)-C(2))-methyltransferase RlmN [Candidatus Manganitrophaceae bacterium]|nr:MAG: 23S rRNA (adenine(2503)-C(2))-methyltransferase RlmN [Candidatus Manganitrophaceae bacterium]